MTATQSTIANTIINNENHSIEMNQDYKILPSVLSIQNYIREIDNIHFAMQTLTDSPYYLKFVFDNTEDIEKSDTYMVYPTKKSDLKNKYVREVANGPVFTYHNCNLIYWNGPNEYNGMKIKYTNQNNLKLDSLVLSGNDLYVSEKDFFTQEDDDYESVLIKYEEGSLLKLFYHPGQKKWILGTSKNYNAFDVYHLSKNYSFGDYLVKYLETGGMTYDKFLEKHDKNKCYTYLITIQNINTVFEQNANIRIKFISEYHIDNNQFHYNYHDSVVCQKEDIVDFLKQWKECDDTVKENYMIVRKPLGDKLDNNIIKIKIVNPEYEVYTNIIHNTRTSSIYNRFIELRDNTDSMLMLATLSRDYTFTYNKFKSDYNDLITFLHMYYTEKFYLKTKINDMEKEYQKILNAITFNVHKMKKKRSVKYITKSDFYMLLKDEEWTRSVSKLLNDDIVSIFLKTK